MLPSQRRVMPCSAVGTLSLLLLLLTPDWTRPVRPVYHRHPAGLSTVTITAAAASAGVTAFPARPSAAVCPSGRFVTVSAAGRLGNKLCQYSSLWSLQRDDARARPAWPLTTMQRALAPLFSGLAMPTLPEACTPRSRRFSTVPYSKFDHAASGSPRHPLLLSDYPCDLRRFHRHREALLKQLKFRADVQKEARRRLRRHTTALCRGPPACTYIGVHARRTDYGPMVKKLYNSTLAGEKYLRRTLELCRRSYRRPVFVVSSDDLAWVRRRLHAADVVAAGSRGAGSAGRDLALLAQCNHTVMTHGTFGFWAAFLARGDVLAPTGFGARDSYLSITMRQRGYNVTLVPAF